MSADASTQPGAALAACAARVQAALEGTSAALDAQAKDMPVVTTEVTAAKEVLQRLKQRAGFAQCTLVTAVDHFPSQPRFEVIWQLLSHAHADRVRVRAHLPQGSESVPTCSDLWPGANWSERECFDMFGIRFDGHPDLRRLLMPEGYDHHPLRKEFPHRGIEPDRLYREWDDARRERDATYP